jgi:hypothetical protein
MKGNMDFKDRQLYNALKVDKYAKPQPFKADPSSVPYQLKKVERPAFGQISEHQRDKLDNVGQSKKHIGTALKSNLTNVISYQGVTMKEDRSVCSKPVQSSFHETAKATADFNGRNMSSCK